jgi:hypothetical protein
LLINNVALKMIASDRSSSAVAKKKILFYQKISLEHCHSNLLIFCFAGHA